MRDYLLGIVSGALLVACSSAATDEAAATAGSAVGAAPTIAFSAGWQDQLSGSLVAGQPATVTYAVGRLAACRGAGARVTGYASVNGVPPVSFDVTAGSAPLALPFAGDLALWFEGTDGTGCTAWDSAYGANYHFPVAPPANAPAWIGNGDVAIDREGCNDEPCSHNQHPLTASAFTFDTLARQQLGFARVRFQVWQPRVTDFPNPDLWKQLDVELHARVGDQAAFTTSYVNFDEYTGNNARYAIDLRTIDPLPGLNGGALTDKSQCPTFPTTISADGQYIQTDYQFYFTVNGVSLQPPGGGVFHGLYENYAGLYAVCR